LLVADEDDRVRLQIQGFKTLNEVRGFLAGRQAVEIKTPQREVAYGFIAETLRRFGYARLGRTEEGGWRPLGDNGSRPRPWASAWARP